MWTCLAYLEGITTDILPATTEAHKQPISQENWKSLNILFYSPWFFTAFS